MKRPGALVGTIALALACTAGARAQSEPEASRAEVRLGDWSVVPTAEERARWEFRHDPNGADSVLLVNRARLGATVERDPIQARVVLQDARVIGGGPPLAGGPLPFGATGAYEAWVEARTSGVSPSYLRVGRQAIGWGEGRLLGTNDWAPAARAFDALRGGGWWGLVAWELLAAALTQPTAAPTVALYGELLGARATVALDPLLSIEAAALARFAQRDAAPSLDGTVRGQTYTAALRGYGAAAGWRWSVEGATQLGHVDLSNEPRAAWAAAGWVDYAFERVALRPAARLGAAYASGGSGGGVVRTFDPMFPDAHEWHGAMDLFAWSNEAEASARLAATPWTGAQATLEVRYARLADAGQVWRNGDLVRIGVAPGNASAELGHEIDGALAWPIGGPIEVLGGYSLFVLGPGGRAVAEASQIGSSAWSHFVYAQLSARVR